MGARFRSWRQKINKPFEIIIINTCLVGFGVLVVLIVQGYIFNWGWTGLGPYISPPHSKDSDFQRGKTLWDWLQLLIIPLALAIIAILFNRSERKNEQRIASDNQQETALQEYIKEMSELLLHEKLRESQPGDEVRTIARVRTLTVLPRLDANRIDANRKGSVLQFLYESDLIERNKHIIDLSGADLRYADLRYFDLIGANLSGAILSEANLCGAKLNGINLSVANLNEAYLGSVNLSGAYLDGAYLIRADLSGADISGADLSGAMLYKATVITEQLDQAKSLKGATMPNGDIHL